MQVSLDVDIGPGLQFPQPVHHSTVGFYRLVKIVTQLVDAQHQIDAVVLLITQQGLQRAGLLPAYLQLLLEHVVNAHAGAGEKIRFCDAGILADAHRAAVADEQGVLKGIFRRKGRFRRV